MEEFATSGGHYGGDDKFEKASSRSNSTVSSVSTPKVTDELPKKESQGAKPSSPSTDAPKIKDDDKLPENLSTAPTIVQANNATEKRVTAEVSHSKAAPVDESSKTY